MAATNRSSPQAKKSVLSISPYVGGKSSVQGVERVFKLSSNESPLGPSPRAVEAYQQAIEDIGLYPEGSSRILREAVAKKYGLAPDHIICGCGSDEIFSMLGTVFLEPGSEVIFTEHGFLVYRIVALANGAEPIAVPETNLTANVDAMLAAVTERTRIVFLANPNNPTGTYLPVDEVHRLQAGLPEHVLLVLDGAYAEYVQRNDYASGIELVATSRNVIMTRTFSKIYGLAGLRVGWAYAPSEMIETLNRVRQPFNVNVPAQAAAVAALADQDFVDKAIAHNAHWLEWVCERLSSMQVLFTKGVGNFVLVHFPDPAHPSSDANAFLQSRGVIVRDVANYGLPNSLRVSIGTEEANKTFVSALQDFLDRARPGLQ